MAYALIAIALSVVALTTAPQATAAVTRISTIPGANGTIYAISEPDSVGTRYIGGDFTAFNSWGTGGGSLVDNQTGSVNSSFPKVTGAILASAADGSGGFYIGGAFTSVDGVARNNLAHINSDGLLTDWDPNANSAVRSIAVSGSTVYLGGSFTTIGGTTRNRVAAINTDGTLTNWNPNAISTVNSIVVSGSTIYLAGSFTTIGGTIRNRVAAINTDGTLTNWNPNNGIGITEIYTLAVSDGIVYLGGSFTTIGGTTRNYAAAINTDGTLTNWNPNA
ncbi:MAG: hypothetical protein EBW68_02620, partial [Actinobacteria bacterium]|nr:hypothetical protein [Actinomycetota bacterium]